MSLTFRLSLHYQMHILMLLTELTRTIPPVRNTNNDPRISGASCEGMLHASLVQFNIICVKETLLKGFNCVTIIMYYVTRDAYVTTSLWNKVSSCYPPSWAHVVKPSSRFVLYTLDNIPPILLHGGSDTELTFNSDYCCRRFLVEISWTSLFFEQCLLLYSSVVYIYYLYIYIFLSPKFSNIRKAAQV